MRLSASIFSAEWERQIERLPTLINISRCLIAVAVCILCGVLDNSWLDGQSHALWWKVLWLVVYVFIIMLSLWRPDWQRQQKGALPNVASGLDIAMIIWFACLIDGWAMGFAILVLPFVVTSCLLSYGQYPLLYASYTSLLLSIFTFITGLWDTHLEHLLLLILGVFIVAYLAAYIANYLGYAAEEVKHSKSLSDQMGGLNHLVLNSVPEAVVVLDKFCKVRFFNRQTKTYLPSIQTDQIQPLFSNIIKQWQRCPEAQFEEELNIRDKVMKVRAIPLILRHEKLLVLYFKTLQEASAEAMTGKLASLGRLTANLAHEIRNPMSAIRHANDLLQEGIDDPASVRLHDIIDGNVKRIDTLLSEVSVIHKQDNMKPQEIHLMSFWLDFKQEFLLNNPEAVGCIQLKKEDSDLRVRFDPTHLRRIFWNLCNNAWRHSLQDEHAVCVSMRVKADKVYVLVMDNGSGVPANQRNRLFEPFFTTAKNGTGLGLYISRELAQANGGQLYHRPEVNGFEMVLPRIIDDFHA